MSTLCIYHGQCADGFAAAYVVRLAYKARGEPVDFHAGVYGDAPPDVTGRDVVIVDFSYKRAVLEEMARTARTITIIDHHKSAEEDLAYYAAPPEIMDLSSDDFSWIAKQDGCAVIRAHFDMKHCGAVLVWDHFFPDVLLRPILRHIEDRDLWKFELEGTREIMAAVFSYPYEWPVWDALWTADVDVLRSMGESIERKQRKDIAEFIEMSAHRLVIAGHSVPALNAPYMWASDAGHLMAEIDDAPFAVCYWQTANGRSYSLRSTSRGLDVSEIAKLFGGGGHKHAAGFRVGHGVRVDVIHAD